MLVTVGSILFAFIFIFLISNLQYGISSKPPERIQVGVDKRIVTNYEDLTRLYPNVTLLDAEKGIFHVPIESLQSTVRRIQSIPGVVEIHTLPGTPTYSFSQYFNSIGAMLSMYAKGEFGYYYMPVGGKKPFLEMLPTILKNSLTYFVPGFLAAIVGGVLFAVFATMSRVIGKIFDWIHRVLLMIPDFFIYTLLLMFAIYITKFATKRVILIIQLKNEVPFFIPFMTIMIVPGVLIYGVIRLALQREMAEPYIRTAIAKGFSHKRIVITHAFLNVLEDLLTILPRATTVAIGGMIIAEVLCRISGIGGYLTIAYSNLPITCAILALFALIMQGIYALLRKMLIVSTKEVNVSA
ncbi:ABC transporter permease subunit [Paenibacillus sp. N1-5-1-14]|uniref:ABC transporter permease subunit n=1 Tax=Paenibacillus radicibacter TaxID=2972488 RepID=UPI002158AE9B|nr:ABC transporter permease subunit [Paenibacillus radicibacter]MCR8644196.1 ABC transporter permease subunit [Paenibacillus radicibacter]